MPFGHPPPPPHTHVEPSQTNPADTQLILDITNTTTDITHTNTDNAEKPASEIDAVQASDTPERRGLVDRAISAIGGKGRNAAAATVVATTGGLGANLAAPSIVETLDNTAPRIVDTLAGADRSKLPDFSSRVGGAAGSHTESVDAARAGNNEPKIGG